MYFCRNLQSLELHNPKYLYGCRNLQYLGQHFAEHLPKCPRVLVIAIRIEESVSKPWWHVAGRCLDLDSGDLDGCHLDTRHFYGLRLDPRRVDP